MTGPILHITTRSAWLAAQGSGSYRADTLESEGFIHCSKPDQVLRVANMRFAGQQNLVLLAIDPAKLKGELRWEPGTDRSDELFPHLYAPLNLEAVIRVVDFEAEAQGGFTRLPL